MRRLCMQTYNSTYSYAGWRLLICIYMNMDIGIAYDEVFIKYISDIDFIQNIFNIYIYILLAA